MATHELTITTEVQEPGGLYFRTALVSGKAPDGVEVELSLSATGAGLIFRMTQPDDQDDVTHTINTGVLLQAWADSLEEQKA